MKIINTSVETRAKKTPRHEKNVRGIMATRFAWNRGDGITGGGYTSYYCTKLPGLPSE